MTDKVRFVGDPVAFVVAETLAQARDAAEAVVTRHRRRCRPSPIAQAATKPGAPASLRPHPEQRRARLSLWRHRKVDAAFASAAHVDQARHREHPRRRGVDGAARARSRPTTRPASRYALQVPTQGVAGNRKAACQASSTCATDKVRILTAQCRRLVRHEEHQLSRIHLHRCTRRRNWARPVKWTDERSTSFLSDSHGRAQQIHAELALDAEGKFLAVRLQGYGNLGAYITGVAPGPLSLNTGKNLASVYTHAAARRRHQDAC